MSLTFIYLNLFLFAWLNHLFEVYDCVSGWYGVSDGYGKCHVLFSI